MGKQDDDTTIPEDTSPAGLRAIIDKLTAKLGDRDGTIRTLTFKLAGIDPSKGIGKAIAATYQGDMTPEAMLAYGKSEYDWQPETAPPAETPGDPAATGLVERGQEQADAATAITTGGAGGKKPNLDEQIADAESKGDWNRSITLKALKSNPLVKKE